MKFIILLLLVVGLVDAQLITNFATHDFSCTCSQMNPICSCYFNWARSVFQFNDVSKVQACYRHACFQVGKKELTCSGRVFSTLGKNKYFNPLTPIEGNKGFSLGDSVLEIDHGYLGYNLNTAYLEFNAKTVFESAITNFTCDGRYGTCVDTKDGKRQCFGIPKDIVFHDDFVSFILGVLIQIAISFPIFLSMRYVLKRRPNALYFCSVIFAAPLSMMISFIIVNFAKAFFVKMYIFIIGGGVGLVLADLSAKVLIRVVTWLCMSKIDQDMIIEQSTELISKNDEEEEGDETESKQSTVVELH